MSSVEDEDCIARCQESFDREVVRKDNFIQRVQEWIVRVEEAVRLDAQISPQDSVSRTGSQPTSKPSRWSEHSSRSGSHKSSGTSLSVVRAKEAARMAELKAEVAILKKRQFLEEQRFRLKQDEKRLTLETEIAKSKAREDALASMDPNRRLVVLEPKGVESKPGSVVLNQTKCDRVYQFSRYQLREVFLPTTQKRRNGNTARQLLIRENLHPILVTRVHHLHLVKGPSTRCWSCTSTRIYYSNSRTTSLRCL